MNSGIHDAINLCEKLEKIYKGGDADTLLGKFERQRHKTTHDFIQAQTMRNMEYLAQGDSSEHQLRKSEMQRQRSDDTLRRTYLLRQSMIESLEQQKAIA